MGIAELTGLGGNSSPALLDNKGELNKFHKKVLGEAIKAYFGYWNGCDYGLSADEIKFGIEPTYFGDELLIVSINRNKDYSYIQRGHAFGYYGTGIRSKVKYYKDYKYKSKFRSLVDKWHKILF